MSLNIPSTDRKRVVVIGGGFAGLSLLHTLRHSNFQVVLIDKHNYHTFKPLLYQVAGSSLNVGDIAFPFRKMFHGWDNFYFRMAYIDHIEPEKHQIVTVIGTLQYDYLVIATGGVPNFYGMFNIKSSSLPMSNITDALNIRNRILRNFEIAATTPSEEERMARMNIVIVGGGASGVEIAGVLAEMREYIIPRDYPRLDTSHMKIYLIEGRERVLFGMSAKSSAEALQTLERKGIDVIVNRKITDYIDHYALCNNGERIATYNLIWTSGIKCGSLPGIAPSNGPGSRFGVDAFNRVQGLSEVYAIGDAALMISDPNYPHGHPQLARVAISQGTLLGHNLMAAQQGRTPKPYRYRNLGVMATVGRNRAFVEWSTVRCSGFIAWMLWSVVHIMSLLTVQGKLKVFIGWVWNYFGHDLPIRLIIGPYEQAQRDTPPDTPDAAEPPHKVAQ